jgi:hypothetical protein
MKQSDCSALSPELLNGRYVHIAICSRELLANLLRVLPYNKRLGAEVRNMAKAT